MGAARRAISDWPAERRAIAETVLNIAELIADVCFDVVLFVVGANVGVVEGIVDLVVGLLVALEKLVEYMLSWLLQPFDDGRHFREMNEHLIAAVRGLPEALRKAFSDWQQEYLAADPDKKAFMLGRLFGQLVVLLLGAAETGGAAGAAVAGARVAVPAFELATTGARLGGGTISLAALGPPAAAMTALGTASAQVSGEQTVSDLGKEAPKPKPKQERLPEDFAGDKEFEKAWQERTRGEPNEIARKREPGRRADITGKPGEAAGQTVPASLAQKVNNVLGRTLAENSELSRCWEEAKTAVLKNRRPGTPAEALSAYKAAVRPFWERVWDNPGARRLFEDNGFVFPKRGNAPLVQGYEAFPRKLWDEFRVSLDHMAPKATGDNWRFSLDASNLQLRIHADNTMIQNLEVRHPELAR
jgi:hypothetical protein